MDPTKKELYTTKRSSGIDCSDPNIIDMWERIKDDDQSMKWLLISYSNPSTVILSNTGESIEEMVSYLNDNECFFGVFRCKVGGGVKFFTWSFVGEEVNGMKKGKASMHRSAIFNLFEVHGTVTLTGQSEANVSTIIQQISQQFRVSADDVKV